MKPKQGAGGTPGAEDNNEATAITIALDRAIALVQAVFGPGIEELSGD